jgi:hypothetical protein
VTAFVPSDARVLQALAAILPAGTHVDSSSVYIEKGLAALGGGFPALILTIPDDERLQVAFPSTYGWTHQVAALYLERWETSARTYEQVMAQIRADLDLMCQNVADNPTLHATVTAPDGTVLTDVANAIEAGTRIRRFIDAPVKDSSNAAFGVYQITASLLIQVRGLFESY